MDKERRQLIVRLGIWAMGIAAVCTIIIFAFRACSKQEPESVIESPQVSVQSEPPRDLQEPGNDPLTNYEDCENNATWGEDLVGSYQNDKVLTYNYGGGTISLGVNAPEAQEGLYLNPSCSEASTSGIQVGFFITSSSPELYCSSQDGAAPDEDANVGAANFVLLGETYDTAIPAAYKNAENYGIRWEHDPLAENKDSGGTTLYIRAVNMSNGQPLALCRATIAYDAESNSYTLATLTSADVVDTGEMSIEEKADLVDQAVQFMVSQNSVTLSEGWASAKAGAKVEHVPTTYFPTFLGPNDEVLNSHDKPYQNCEIWAVNLPLSSYNVTVYFASRLQIVLGSENTTIPGSDELDLTPIGCARLDPRSTSTIYPPA